MGKNLMLIFFIALILIIIIFLLLPFLVRRRGHYACRELSQEEIRPMLKRITGHELPGKAEDLRAILYTEVGLEDIFVAFKTDQEGFSHILEEFGGQDVMRGEFPKIDKINNPFEWDIYSFDMGYKLQKKLNIDLFDKDLFDRIKLDALEHLKTGHYPKDAVAGYYLEFTDSSELLCYRVLIFKDRGLVYIFAEKQVKGVYHR